MDRAVIEQKLESLRRCIARIESKRPFTSQQLAEDFDLQDIVALNLTRAVQLSVDMAAHLVSNMGVPAPNTYFKTFAAVVVSRLKD